MELASDPHSFGVVAKHYKFFEQYYAAKTEPRGRRPRVLVLWGESGTGKTVHAHMASPGKTFFVPIGSSGGTWFDGYDPRKHNVVVFNEWHGGRGSLSELLQWCDETPLYVNTKGAHMQFVPDLLIFTCNKDPKSWYEWQNCAHPSGALIRRITNQWQYVKQAQPEWGEIQPCPDSEDGVWYSFAIREQGMEDFHPARRCMQHLKDLPDGKSLWGFAEDTEIGDNVVEEDPDRFFI